MINILLKLHVYLSIYIYIIYIIFFTCSDFRLFGLLLVDLLGSASVADAVAQLTFGVLLQYLGLCVVKKFEKELH